MKAVKLSKGMFKISQDKGKEYLMYLDCDRLLAPCYEAIGRKPKKQRYGGWEAKAISGHSLGHYMSALSAMYAADGDLEIKKKLEYIISELVYIQSFDTEGYVSGFSKECFEKVFSGDFEVNRFELGGGWVPWYSIHKIFAGLIDAYEITNNEMAFYVVKNLSDWAVNGTKKMDESSFKKMLYCEHGGMCEVMAKMFRITKNKDYLNLAIRFIDNEVIDPLINHEDNLEGMHANTQIPKILGICALYQITKEEKYKDAAEFFFDVVTRNRSYVIGGNSRDEHFGKSKTEELGVTTAETCNTYNMLKLAEYIYSWNHDSVYMDYYENALYNHILASQDPDSGMKTYFVSTKPGHFKVYCSPDNSFWCCTGTGMENSARYPRNIYFVDDNELYINLFISSEIKIAEKNIIVRQETDFPYSNKVKIVIEKAAETEFKINIRVPEWANKEVQATVNRSEKYIRDKSGYISINKKWHENDVIDIVIPMGLQVYTAKDDKHKIAFKYGPIVLAGAFGKKNFPKTDIVEDHLKLNHYPDIDVPRLVTDKNVIKFLEPVKNKKLAFRINNICKPDNIDFELIPFYQITHQRYTIYWIKLSENEYKSGSFVDEEYKNKLENITIDNVNTNEQQSEIEHNFECKNSESGYMKEAEKGWRYSFNEGYFSYCMKIDPNKGNYVALLYGGDYQAIFSHNKNYESGFRISVDDNELLYECINERKYTLFNKFYHIPKELIKGKLSVRIKISADKNKVSEHIFGIRITTEKID